MNNKKEIIQKIKANEKKIAETRVKRDAVMREILKLYKYEVERGNNKWMSWKILLDL